MTKIIPLLLFTYTALIGEILSEKKLPPSTTNLKDCAIGQVVHDDGCCVVLLPPATIAKRNQSNDLFRSDSETESLLLGDDACTDNNTIDVLWVYTPDALAYMGSIEEVLLQCQIAVDDANITFSNTELPFDVRIVGLHETQYEETPDYLAHLQNPNDGYMDEIHEIRDRKGADIVALITVTGSCGLAYVSPNDPNYGFQECSAYCLVEEWASPFRHELGHNLGSQHYVTDNYGYFTWSSGHRLTPPGSEEIGTSMAGNNIPYFSNPNIFYGASPSETGVPTGFPIGTDEEADNYSAFLVTVPMVADFRCSDDICEGDTNLDGNINVIDLLEVLESWGPCLPCNADVVFNGTVDVIDLLAVVSSLGKSCNETIRN